MKPPHILPNTKKGSALVLTLMVVSLLLVIVLALVAHVRMELRNVTNHQAHRVAQQNAVLALNLGVARLQETAGADQRATATASSVSHTGAPGGTPRPGTAQWSGVWRAGASSRVDGREPQPEMLDWLVSGRITPAAASSVTPGQYASGLQEDGSTTRPDEIVLVGRGTMGAPGGPAGVSAADFVVAPKVELDNLVYAFWVGEENVKARINVADETPGTISGAMRRVFAPGASPVNAMADLESLPLVNPVWERVHSVPGQNLLYPAAAPWLRRNFHSATLTGASVLSNPSVGGLKSDLSLAFELDDAAFNRTEFARALVSADPVRTNINQNFTNRAVFAERDPGLYIADPGSSPNTDYLSGPSWHFLRDFFRLYKEADPVTGVITSRPMSPNRPDGNNNSLNSFIKSNTVPNLGFTNESNALRQRHSNQTKTLPTGVEVVPEFQRLVFLYGLRLIDGSLHLIIEPIAVVHNPYNIPVEMPGMLGLWALVDQAIMVETFLPAAADSNSVSPHATEYNGNSWAGKGAELMTILHPDGRDTTLPFVLRHNRSGTQPIRFEPGEIKYFTSGLSRTEVVSPGDIRVFELVEGLNPATLFQGHGYAYPLDYSRRVGTGFEHGPLVLPPGGTVFAHLQATPGPNRQTDRDVPGIANIGRHRGGPGEYGGFHLYHLRENQLNDDFNSRFPARPTMISHTQRGNVPYADLRELRLWPDEILGGEFYVQNSPKRRFTEAELSQVRYFAANDFYLKPVNDDQTRSNNINPIDVFSQHNPRAPIGVPWETGGRGVNGTRIVQTWSIHNRHLQDGRPDGVFGTGLDGRRGLWGDGLFAQEGGVETVVLYEIPREPMGNLVQFSHAPLSFWTYQPMHALGNSRANAHIPRDQIWHKSDVALFSGTVSFQFDNAYLLNEALWDGYFFSGITGWNGPGASAESLGNAITRFVSNPESLATLHPRLRLLNPGMANPAVAGLDLTEYNAPQTSASRLRPHNRVAQHVLMEGGFNVNSVSVDAWRAVLSGLSGQGVVRVDAAGRLNLQNVAPQLPFGAQAAYRGGSGQGEAYSGHRPLSADEVNQLASAIVAEIRGRNSSRGGPFLSMGEFLNRRLLADNHPDAAQGLAGVLQAAIHRVESINEEVENAWGTAPNLNGFFTWRGGPDEVRVPYIESNAFGPTTRRGMSQHLDQRAILSVIGSSSTVRSDTFRVRAYGATPGGAQAWCEAIVQRVPDFVDPSDPPAAPLEVVNDVNKRFGRKFRIVSFQWLNPDEI
jgi:hypothetical protein